MGENSKNEGGRDRVEAGEMDWVIQVGGMENSVT